MQLAWRVLAVGLATERRNLGVLAGNVLLNLFWAGWALLLLDILYGKRDTILGWSQTESLTMLGFYLILNGVRQAVISESLETLADELQFKRFDDLLLIPANTRLLLGLKSVNTAAFTDCVSGLGIVVVATNRSGTGVGTAGLLTCLLFSLTGVCFMSLLGTVMQSLVLMTRQTNGLDAAISALMEICRFPPVFYGGAVATFVLSSPVAYFSALPTEALSEPSSFGRVLTALAVMSFSLLGAGYLWRRAIRIYTRRGGHG
ncbi:ABC-2 family transporter protein [Micromonospora sp. NPDC000089]|uniref:ABC-2 family transporter protein n=1 Tax=unclassified Micromonospora TaxID=2617518 RepID=UPI003693C0C4